MKVVFKLRYANNALGAVTVALAIYIFIWPFLPAITWWTRYQAPVISHKPTAVLAAETPIPKDNTLLIPKLDMRETVYESKDMSALNKGIWHLPDSNSPDMGGNTIFAGHRFTYSGKAVLYYLDKVSTGDNVYLYWEGKRYDYLVTGVNIVTPNDATLIAPTETSTLTIYTCTPVWSAKDRLVITAKLVEKQE